MGEFDDKLRGTPDHSKLKPDGPEGTSDESIGRPSEWREGRYEKPGTPVDRSVVEPDQKSRPPPDAVSTPVTRKDYENLDAPSPKNPPRSR